MHASSLSAAVLSVCIDSGAKYGEYLLVLLFLFSFLAYLWKHFSMHTILACRRNLAQVFCVANGFCAILGVNLFSGLILAVLDTTSYPFSSFLLSFGSPMSRLAFCMLIASSHFSGLSRDSIGEGRQKMLYDIFGIDIPCWLRRVAVGTLAMALALYSEMTTIADSILLFSGCTCLFFAYRLFVTTALRRSNTQRRERMVSVPVAGEEDPVRRTTRVEAEDDASILDLTRSSRLQVVAILDEFWEQLYDSQGQFTLAEKGKRLDEKKLLESVRRCVLKLMRVKGSKWLFRRTNVVEEELVRHVAAKERYLYKSNPDHDNIDFSPPNCGQSCAWRPDLVVSFGVWCIHRVLELSMDHHYPELSGKYGHVLYCLRGVIDVALFKELGPTRHCICLELDPGNGR